jgi:hypothetical protein
MPIAFPPRLGAWSGNASVQRFDPEIHTPQGISGIILDSPEHGLQLLVVARDGFIGQSRRPAGSVLI